MAAQSFNSPANLPRNPLIVVVFISIFVQFLWIRLDANPLLFAYDAYVTIAFATTTSPSPQSESPTNLLRDESIFSRRMFRHGSTGMEDKTVWVTGASSGIGAELAIQLASAGVGHLILSGRRQEKLESVSRSCKTMAKHRQSALEHNSQSKAIKVSIVPFDMVGGSEVLDVAVSRALQFAGPSGIDILVLNAGQYQCSPALETDLDIAVPRLMQINFASPVHLSQRLIHADRWSERKHGHIVVVSSIVGRGSSPLNAVYSASKHALRAYFHSLAAEERGWLRVDVVCPGATNTGLWDGSWKSAEGGDRSWNAIPQKKQPLHADDRSKMTVQRCAQLMVSSMMGPNFLFFETWITRNPGLLWVYLASYEPMTFRTMTNYVIAPLRMGLWRKDGSDPLFLPTLLRYSWECVSDYFTKSS